MKRSGLRGPRGWSELKDNGGSWLTHPKKKEKVSLVVSLETCIWSGLRRKIEVNVEEESFCIISWLLSIKVEGNLGILNGKIRGVVTLF